MKENHLKCLLLNVDYTPVSIITWKRAMVWHFKYEKNNNYGIDIVDFYKNDFINGINNQKFPVPAVARTKRYYKTRHNNNVVFSRKNIFLRDDYTCQYCGGKFEYAKLTYDHIIPRSNSGPTNWTNIVTACVPCNSKKGNRTPKQAGMPLLKIPEKPQKRLRYLPIYEYVTNIKYVPDEWTIYLPNL